MAQPTKSTRLHRGRGGASEKGSGDLRLTGSASSLRRPVSANRAPCLAGRSVAEYRAPNPNAAMIEKANVEKILERLREVEAQLAEPGTAADQKKYRGLVREHASLRKPQDRATAYYRLVDTVESDRAMAEDPSTDEEMRELAKAELEEA